MKDFFSKPFDKPSGETLNLFANKHEHFRTIFG